MSQLSDCRMKGAVRIILRMILSHAHWYKATPTSVSRIIVSTCKCPLKPLREIALISEDAMGLISPYFGAYSVSCLS